MIDTLFSLGNMTAMTGWCLLIFVPRWRGIAQAAATYALPGFLSVAYGALIAAWWGRGEGGFGTLAEVQTLFGTRELVLAGWLHYLAFDLFVGAWVSRECRRDGVPHLAVVPILVLTFLFGPMGYLTSLAVRLAWRIAASGDESAGVGGPVAQALRSFARREPRLVAASFVCAAAMIPTLFAAWVDRRTIDGVDVWVKPLKFEASVAIYLATLAFFAPLASEAFWKSRAGRYVVWGSIVTGFLEVIYIGWRASRGEASHFNMATHSAAILYAMMGIAAVMLAASGPILAWGVARADARPAPPAYRLAVILGLWMSFGLGAVGGAAISAHSGHSVGHATPGDAALPFVGWSRTVGDLRVAHFFGLHSQQSVALAGALAVAVLGTRARGAVVAFAGIYAAVTIGLFVEALAGRPFLPL